MTEKIRARDLRKGDIIPMTFTDPDGVEHYKVTGTETYYEHGTDKLDVWTYCVERPLTAPYHFYYRLDESVSVDREAQP